MRILMVGAGATGGFYGGKLVQAGRDVTFLLHERRAEQIRARGLEVRTPEGGFTVHPKILTSKELRDSPQIFDLIVISTKAYQLEAAMEDFAPAVGPETMLLPTLNGLAQLAILDARFGSEHVLGGSVRIASDLDEQGRVLQFTDLGELSYGERSGKPTARLLAVDAAMRDAGFDAKLQPDILSTLWEKWWFLSSVGAICVVGRGTIGEVAVAPRGPEFVHAVVAECAAIATANGYPPVPAALASHLERMTDVGSTLTSSMYRDMHKGAPVEADHILGDLLARANGTAAPLLTAAYVQLKVYEARRLREK